MDILSEYRQQQTWRNWNRYLDRLPLKSTDTVLDLGCSVGDVSHLFAQRACEVIGIDINQEFVDFCQKNKVTNQHFLCQSFEHINFEELPRFNGVWASFSLSYLSKPLEFLRCLHQQIFNGGWVAMLDVSSFISGNMPEQSEFYQLVKAFEQDAIDTSGYDFNFGSKMAPMLQQAGFTLLCQDDDVFDVELNFSGKAPNDVINVWQARLKRMPKLERLLGANYPRFVNELLENLASPAHEKRQSLQFVVAQKQN